MYSVLQHFNGLYGMWLAQKRPRAERDTQDTRDDIESSKEIHEYLLVDCDGLSQSPEIRFHAQTDALRHGDLAAALLAPPVYVQLVVVD